MMSIISLGMATTQGAKMAAYGDIGRLAQRLARSAPWETLSASVVTQVAKKFTAQFGQNLTKKKLGQFVPVAGVLVGAGLNYVTVDRVADAAQHRDRRFDLSRCQEIPNDGADGPRSRP